VESVSEQPAKEASDRLPLPARLLVMLALALPAWLDGCSSAPPPLPVTMGHAEEAPGSAEAIPKDVEESFGRAVGLMKQGNTDQAVLQFRQILQEAPQLAAPYINLGILYRKAGKLDEAEQAFRSAVQHNAGSAVGWTELGVTQRLRGEFKDAADSYEKAIAADPRFAPAYRNLGVVSDLYLGDPERALGAFEHYKDLTGEDKPVSNWIAELRQRTGKAQPRPASAPAAPPAAAPQEAPDQASPPRA
jgi:Flp pilus assembly protein TadD